jgi:hypothetical protein
MITLTTEQKVVGAFCGIVLVMLIYRAFLWQPHIPPPPAPKACKGEALYVDYAFIDGDKSPHGCAIQCEDRVQRYLVYTDGYATQCEMTPGCFDWGEDNGITCAKKEGE